MEPQNAQSNPSPEMGAYHAPESPKSAAAGETVQPMPERSAASPETAPVPQTAPVAVKPLPQLPTLPAPQPGSSKVAGVPAKDHNPVSASDEDVIEKEWVDKAKKIVAQTKGDPYEQEKEISKLQADYLKKRYGREIKLNSD